MIMSNPMRTAPYLAMALTLSGLLAACGRSSSQDPNAVHLLHVNRKPATQTATPNTGIDPDMVSAVSAAGNSTTPISMKFRLASRPTVTTPLQVTLLLIPSPDVIISHIHLSVQPGDGLRLQSERTLDVSDVGSGTLVKQDLTVVPQQSGMLSLTATVLVDTDSQSISRTYSIPLIVIDSPS
jgi:hypothetical protein